MPRNFKIGDINRRQRYLYIAVDENFNPIITTPTKGGSVVNVIPVDTANGSTTTTTPPKNTTTTTPVSNPELEVDFNSLSCSELKAKIDWLGDLFTRARFTQESYSYYQAKMAQMQSVYDAKCKTTSAPSAPKTNGTILTPKPTSTTTATATPTTSGTTVNVGDTSGMPGGMGLGLGGGGGAGGGGGGDKKPVAKKSNLWLWLLVAGTMILAFYQTRKSKLSVPAA